MNTFTFIEVGSDHKEASGKVTLEENNTLSITRDFKVQSVSASAFQQGSQLVIVSDKLFDDFGMSNDFKLNYCYLMLTLDILPDGGARMAYGSKFIYGYNHENSFIDLTHNLLIGQDVHSKLQEDFKKAFGGAFSLDSFLRTFVESVDLAQASQEIDKLMGLAVLKQNTIETIDWKIPHNVVVLHHSDRPVGVDDILLQSIMASKGHFVFFAVTKEEERIDVSQLATIDIAIILSNKAEEEYDYIPSGVVKKVLNFGFYSVGAKLLQSLASLQTSCIENNKPDRKAELEDAFKEFNKNNKDGSEGGCCGGKEGGCGSGGCCQDQSSDAQDGGCCGGSSSKGGCCKKESPEEEKKPIVEETKKEEKKGCCNPDSQGN